MFAKNLPKGIIATPQVDVTPPLDELVACCGWPLVLAATPRRLLCELSLHNSLCVLFWIEDRRYVTSTGELIAWLHDRGNRPYRVVIADHLDHEVELVLRAAGAHGYVAVSNDVASAVRQDLTPWLNLPAAFSHAPHSPGEATTAVGRAADVSDLPDALRPP